MEYNNCNGINGIDIINNIKHNNLMKIFNILIV